MKDNTLTCAITTMLIIRDYLKVQDIPMQQVLTYCYVAERQGTEGIPQAELEELTGMAQSSISRHIDKLGRGKPSDPGFGLVEAYEDPFYRKRKLVRLTPRGVGLLEAVKKGTGARSEIISRVKYWLWGIAEAPEVIERRNSKRSKWAA